MSEGSQGSDEIEKLRASWLRMQAAAGERRPRGSALADRRAGEKPPVGAGDGRRLRATGRTHQLNLKVTAEFREELRSLAEARGINMNELLERILEEWKKLGGRAGRT